LDVSWKEDGECLRLVRLGYLPLPERDRIFYPSRHCTPSDIEEARAICKRCEVQPQCLEYALATGEEVGIWGGKTEKERRLLRRARRKAQEKAGVVPINRPTVRSSLGRTGRSGESQRVACQQH
jgi:WhiB family redox-sensing transcriptional regulator